MVMSLLVSAWLAMSPARLPGGCSPLQTAAMNGDLERLRPLAGRSLLGLSAPAAFLDEVGDFAGVCRGRTALMLAAEYGQVEAVKLLLSSRARVDLTATLKEFGDHAFDGRCLAIAAGHPLSAVLLEEAGAPELPCLQDSALFATLRIGNLEQLQRQLRAQPGAPVLRAALGQLAGRSQRAVTAALVDHAVSRGIDLSPLFEPAIEANDFLLVEQLAAHTRLSGSTELARAVTLGRTKMIRPLIEAGAVANTSVAPMRAAILGAIQSHQGSTLDALLENGWRGDDELPVLLWAMKFYPDYVQPLIAYDVGEHIDDEEGVTPLLYATEQKRPDWISRLVADGAGPNIADVTCRTAASVAPTAQIMRLLSGPGEPTPGRAAQRLHVGCGLSHFRLRFEPQVEVYFDGAFVALKPGITYQTSPGLHTLRISRATERRVKRVTLQLEPGVQVIEATPDDGNDP